MIIYGVLSGRGLAESFGQPRVHTRLRELPVKKLGARYTYRDIVCH